MMSFTYESYRNMLYLLEKHGYEFVSYNNWQLSKRDKKVILRHDIDNDISCAVKLARLENEICYGGG